MQVASVPSCSAPEESLRKSTNPAPGLRGGPDFPMITALFRNWKIQSCTPHDPSKGGRPTRAGPARWGAAVGKDTGGA